MQTLLEAIKWAPEKPIKKPSDHYCKECNVEFSLTKWCLLVPTDTHELMTDISMKGQVHTHARTRARTHAHTNERLHTLDA